ncbi:MAG: CHAT domain-containing protein [Paracoccaceae bacterium]|nr:CHAT domain-containing protein [Paracoccaceae bacterium]
MKEGHDALANRLTRAVRLCEDYDDTGYLPDLLAGVEELRKIQLEASGYSAGMKLRCTESLATALIRQGEQTNDTGLLREARTLLADLAGSRTFDEIGPEAFKRANAMAVADLRIATMTGDRELLLTVCRGLARYMQKHPKHAELNALASKNLTAALCENARQHRSEKVYHDVIKQIAPHCLRGSASDRRYYLHYHATALLELGGITGNREHLEKAIVSLKSILDLCDEGSGALPTALHSLAQAHFRAAKLSNGPEAIRDVRTAIDYCSRSIALLGDEDGNKDGRLTRLLADRGAYRHMHGVLVQNKDDLAAALKDYRTARDRIDPAAAPFLLCQVLSGLFLLEYRLEHFPEALQTFDTMRQTWAISLVDPSLSVSVFEQQAVEMVGHFPRAAYCRLKQGDIAGAVVAVEAGRSTQLRLTQRASTIAPDTVPPVQGVSPALQRWEAARRSGDREDRRSAWQAVLEERRKLGMAIVTDDPSPEEIARVVSSNGAAVVIFWADAWINAVLILRDPDRFVEIPLPDTACSSLRLLAHGDANQPGWPSAHNEFVAAGTNSAIEEGEASRTWNDSIASAQAVIGTELCYHFDLALRGAEIAEGAEVLIAPPGELAALPLASARLSEGQAFQDRWSVGVFPGLTQSMAMPTTPSSQISDALIISPATPTGLTKLPFVAREISGVQLRLEETMPRLLADENACIGPVLDGLQTADLVHIASHGRFDKENPDQSCLFLTDGQLSLDKLKTVTPRPIRLVFLSCCESGIAGWSSVPDEFVGLLPSLLQSGAAAAVGTLWPVYDDAAMLFALRFYDELVAPDGRLITAPCTALARAQAWLRSVTLGELVTNRYLSNLEAKHLMRSEQRAAAIRTFEKRMQTEFDSPETHSNTPNLNLRPYCEPIDWAAFVVVGR